MHCRGVHLSPWGCGFTGSLLTGVAKAPATELKSRGCLTPCFHLRSGPLRPVSERCSFFWQELRGKPGRHNLEPRPSNPALAFEIVPPGFAGPSSVQSTGHAVRKQFRCLFCAHAPLSTKQATKLRDAKKGRCSIAPLQSHEKQSFQPSRCLQTQQALFTLKAFVEHSFPAL